MVTPTSQQAETISEAAGTQALLSRG